MRHFRLAALLLVVVPLAFGGCATFQQIAALRDVDFALQRVVQLRLAGVPLDGVRSYADLSVTDLAQLSLALSRQELPLSFNLVVRGENPPDNRTDARLVRFDWTLLLEDRETISGVFTDEVVFRPGEATTFPLRIELDLLEFFDGSARELSELVLNLSGQGGAPTHVALRANPTIQTALGPIRYPGDITIVSTTVGR